MTATTARATLCISSALSMTTAGSYSAHSTSARRPTTKEPKAFLPYDQASCGKPMTGNGLSTPVGSTNRRPRATCRRCCLPKAIRCLTRHPQASRDTRGHVLAAALQPRGGGQPAETAPLRSLLAAMSNEAGFGRLVCGSLSRRSTYFLSHSTAPSTPYLVGLVTRRTCSSATLA